MSKSKFKPKDIQEQTIVITGASSGIGLATAKLAAKKGANVVLSSRNDKDLKKCVEEIKADGGNAISIVADVSQMEDLCHLRDLAIATYGSIDTWINNAGTSIVGYLLDADLEEERKLFETNFWGARMGSRIAVEVMSKQGGTLINLGSEVSVATMPLLGMYSASKHALKAFTESLRSELRDRDIPVEVCLVRPTAIDTPFPDHATNRLDHGEPSLPPLLYSPEIAAEAILKCAVSPQRDVYVGGPARLSAILDTFFPALKDLYAESQMKELKKGTAIAHEESQEGLHHTSKKEGRVRGHNKGHVAQGSLYTQLSTLNLLKTLTSTIRHSLKDYKDIKTH